MTDNNFKIVGYQDAKHYVDANLNVDQAFYSNEDMGLTADIIINDVKRFALPYPADINL